MSTRTCCLVFIVAGLSGCATGSTTERAMDGTARAVPRQPAAASAKRALLIGVNRYKNAATSGFRNLLGCVNDAENMRALLVGKYDFPDDPQHLLVLKDEQATHAGIVSAIQHHLIEKAGPDDIVVVFFAGHGSQMKDASGTRINGMDETIVPHDSRDPAGRVFDISGNELNALLDQLASKTSNVTVVFDSCHSGTLLQDRSIGSRSVRVGVPRVIPPDTRQPPPASRPAGGASRGVGFRPPTARYAFLGGARAEELANEYDEGGRRQGAMTHFLVNELRNAGAAATYRDVMDVVTGRVSEMFASQHPQLEGPAIDQVVFGDKTGLSDAYVRASPLSSGDVELAAGEAQGASVGSIYEVFAPGAKSFPIDQGLAKVKIASLTPFAARAASTGATVPVPPFSRAVERQHHYDSPRLRVALDDVAHSRTLQDIQTTLGAYQQIQAVADRTECDLRLAEVGGAVELRGLGAADPLSKTILDANAAATVADQVVRWSQWFNLRGLANPASTLKVRFQLTTLGGQPPASTLTDGDQFTFTVANASGADLYVSVLDFSTDGSISVIYPPQGAQPRLATGQLFTATAFRATVPAGRTEVSDTLKLFATATPVDFRVLTMRAIGRGPAPADLNDPLGRLLAAASLGTSRNAEAVPLGTWVTADRVFSVQKP